jgi:hypothetical protein
LFESYVRDRDPRQLVACRGDHGLAAAEADAFAATQRRDWRGVLAAVAASERPSAYLRELAGDARWHLRQLASATREYRAGLELVADADARARLQARIDGAAQQLAPIEAAAASASRNGFLAALMAVAAVALGVLLRWR